jgi:hypothetical protein
LIDEVHEILTALKETGAKQQIPEEQSKLLKALLNRLEGLKRKVEKPTPTYKASLTPEALPFLSPCR